MPRPEGILRITASARVLLNLERADAVFKRAYEKGYKQALKRQKNEDAAQHIAHEYAVREYTEYVCCTGMYRNSKRHNYASDLGGRHFEKGPAWDFLKAALDLNQHSEKPLVELVVSSKDDAETRFVIANNLISGGLDYNQGLTLHGNPLTVEHHNSVGGTDLLLTRNPGDALHAVDNDIASAILHMPPGGYNYKERKQRPEFKLDFDGVLVGDASEADFNELGLESYQDSEFEQAHESMDVGPVTHFMAKVSEINAEYPRSDQPFGISIVTSRGERSEPRIFNAAARHGIVPNVSTHSACGSTKEKNFRALSCSTTMYFDDQVRHVIDAGPYMPAALVQQPSNNNMQQRHGKDPAEEAGKLKEAERPVKPSVGAYKAG